MHATDVLHLSARLTPGRFPRQRLQKGESKPQQSMLIPSIEKSQLLSSGFTACAEGALGGDGHCNASEIVRLHYVSHYLMKTPQWGLYRALALRGARSWAQEVVLARLLASH